MSSVKLQLNFLDKVACLLTCIGEIVNTSHSRVASVTSRLPSLGSRESDPASRDHVKLPDRADIRIMSKRLKVLPV